MAKASPIQNAFNAGELSPELEGRTDVGKYGSACYRMENFIPLVQGPARRRGGTKFVNEVRYSAYRTWLATFEFNTEQSYVLEFGDLYVRFYTDNGILESTPGTPVEVVTPWSAADLIEDDGTFALHMVQSGDILYICHPNYAPRKLARTGATTWSLSTLTPQGGPFEDYDPDQTVTVYASAATGTGITITASSATFASTDVGRLFYIEQRKANSVAKWENNKSITAGALRRFAGRNYAALTTGTTGGIIPTHTVGAEYDGDPGVQWEYQDPGYGWVQITAYTSSTAVTATVLSRIPSEAVGSGNATTRWAFGSWGSVPGYPSHAGFFRNRLVFARANDRKLWFSVAADYENFRDRDEGGQVTNDMSVTLTVEADQSANAIQYLITGDDLVIGTAGGEYICTEQTDSDPFGPTNAKISSATEFGSRGVEPVRVGGSILFVQRSGRRVREVSYDALRDGYESLDMSILATHIVPKGKQIVQMAYQKEPHSVVWAARSDGLLLGFTFNREQYTEPPFGGWHRHPLGGSGIVESLVCVPSPTNDRDDLWMIVRRTINGSTKRYVEFMQAEHEFGDDQKDAFYVDCGLTYDSTPATTISGLGHLEGATVDILADGSTHPQRTVVSGSITLQRSASVVQVGLPCPAKLATMRLEAGAADGTAQGKTKRIHRMVVRLLDTLGGKMGPSETEVDEILYRSSANPMDAAVPVFTGDKELLWRGGYEKDARVWYVNDQPLPATVVAIMPQIVTQDR
jgi:hypothetical protein